MLSVSANAAQLFGKVIAVSDGDTLTLLDDTRSQHKVRLAGIDAPERRQPYGERAQQHLSTLAHGKHVLVAWHKRDRYGRLIGRVLAADCPRADCGYSVDVGLEQIRAGLAWHYKQYQDEQVPEDRVRYAALERQARISRAGLWQEAAPVPPWDFRQGLRLEPRATASGQVRPLPGRSDGFTLDRRAVHHPAVRETDFGAVVHAAPVVP